MRRRKLLLNYLNIALISISLTLFTACNSSNYALSDEDSNIEDSSIGNFSGTVVDSYIKEASVCLDLNSDGSCSDELTTQTDANGKFSFTDITPNESSLIVIVSSGGVDTSTEKEFDGELKRVLDLSLTSEENDFIVSPFTDLVTYSFLDSQTKDKDSLSDAKSKVSDIFGITNKEIEEDPMKNKTLFMKSQLLQYTKFLIQTAAIKNSTTSLSDGKKLVLQNSIKEEILNWYSDIYKILITLEIVLDYHIPPNEQTFVIKQFEKLSDSLDSLSSNPELKIEHLSRLQKFIDIKMQEANDNLQTSDTNDTIEVIDINITVSSLTNTIFDSTDAVLDELACLETNNYNVIENSSLFLQTNSDKNETISLRSQYGSPYYNEVQLFYPNLQESKTFKKVIMFEENYYFVFDEAWINNTNNTIYIKTPQDENNAHSCYRFELNSTEPNDMVGTKVFSYSDIQQ